MENLEQSLDIVDAENARMDAKEQTYQNIKFGQVRSKELNQNLQERTVAFNKIILAFILTLAFIFFLSYLKTIFPSMSGYLDFIMVLLFFIGIGYCFLLYYKFIRRKTSNYSEINYSPLSDGALSADQAAALANANYVKNANGWHLNAEGRLVNAQGHLIDAQGRLIDAQGRLVDAQGRLLNAQGQFIDAQGRLVDAQGRLVDAQGRLVDEKGRLINAKGQLIDERGRLVDEQGRLIDAKGRLVNEQGQLIDENGNVLSGRAAFYDAQGRLVDAQGRLVDDEEGRLIDEQGRLIDEQGRLIDEQGRLVDEQGRLIDAQGRLVNENGELLNPDGSVNRFECADYKGLLTPAAYQSGNCGNRQGGNGQGGISISTNASAQIQKLITGEIYLSDDERDVIFVKSATIFNYYLLHKSKDIFESYGSPPGVNFMDTNNLLIRASVISSGIESTKGKKINGKGIQITITNPSTSVVSKSYYYASDHPPLLLQGDTFIPTTGQSNIFVTSQNSFHLLNEAAKVLRSYVSIDGILFTDEKNQKNQAKLLIEPETNLPMSSQVNTRGQCIRLFNTNTGENTYYYYSLNNSLANSSDYSTADIVNAPPATFAPASSFYQTPNQNYENTVQTPQQLPTQATLILHYPFDKDYKNYASGSAGAAGTVVDGTIALNNTNFAVGTGSIYQPERSTNSHFKCESAPANKNGYSFAFWIYFTGTDGLILSFSQNDIGVGGFTRIMIFYTVATNNIYLSCYNSSNTINGNFNTNITPSLNTWYHYTWTLDTNNKNSFYVNGVLSPGFPVTNNNINYGSFALNNNFLMSDSNRDGASIQGYMDDFRYYDGILKESDVKTLYGMKTTPSTPPLILYYPFDTDYKNYGTGVSSGNTVGNTISIDTNTGSLRQTSSTRESYFYIPSIPKNTNGYSFSFWMNLSSNTQSYAVFSLASNADPKYRLLMWSAGGQMHLYSQTSPNYNTDFVPVLNTWYHITWTLDTSGKISFYVNGSLKKSSTQPNYYQSFDSSTMYLFKDVWDGNIGNMIGFIDNFGYYDGILTQSQITDLYNRKSIVEKVPGLAWKSYSNSAGLLNTSDNEGYLLTNIQYNNNIHTVKQFKYTSRDFISMIVLGYFKPNQTGKWSFGFSIPNVARNDDRTIFWIGDGTGTNWPPTDENYNLSITHDKGFDQYPIDLVADQYYPIKIQWLQATSTSIFGFVFRGPGTDWTSNGNGFFFSN